MMPVKIGTFETFADDEFNALQQQKRGTSNPVMVELLNEVQTGRPVRVPLVDGQSARGLRVAISRAATRRGLTVETLEGDGFVAVRQVNRSRTRRTTQGSSEQAPRRGRPPKRQETDSGMTDGMSETME